MEIDTDQYYMQLALKEAKIAFEEDEVPVGAVITYKNKIIAKAHNQIVQLKDPTAHAEIIAITQAANFLQTERLTGSTLYVTIEPCCMCAGAIVLARIDTVVFGAMDPKTGACGSLYNIVHDKRLNHRVNIKQGILKHETAGILQEFFRKKRL